MSDLFTAYDISEALFRIGVFRRIDFAFARFIFEQEKSSQKRLISVLAGLLSYSTTRVNNVCLDITEPLAFFSSVRLDLEGDSKQRFADICSDILLLLQEVEIGQIFVEANSVAICEVIEPCPEPLVYSDGKLYLMRYWEAEQIIACAIKGRLERRNEHAAFTQLKNLDSIYNRFSDFENTRGQQIAVFTALRSNFSIITGGPGTGKTTVVAVILALYFSVNPDAKVALAAPTGKAQARLKEAVYEELQYISVSSEIKDMIRRIEFKTVHSLLGLRKNGEPRVEKLSYDLVVIDEASMVSVLLFSRLFKSLKVSTQLVLLGDQHQLAAVDGGAILSDLCSSAGVLTEFSSEYIGEFSDVMPERLNPPVEAGFVSVLQDCIAPLEYTFRFTADSGIGRLKDLLQKEGDGLENFVRAGYKDYLSSIALHTFSSIMPNVIQNELVGFLKQWVNPVGGSSVAFSSYITAESVVDAFRIFSDFQIITALNKGVLGVERINALIMKWLKIEADGAKGLPVMIEKNDYQTGLFNGDIGMYWPDSSGEMKVWFPDSSVIEGEVPGFRPYLPVKLPPSSPAFAMTIHKSQGSGFDAVLLVLPQVESEILSKELLYTGVTRAKSKIDVFCESEVMLTAAKIKVCRISGLPGEFCCK